jgi:hypothetical protein
MVVELCIKRRGIGQVAIKVLQNDAGVKPSAVVSPPAGQLRTILKYSIPVPSE